MAFQWNTGSALWQVANGGPGERTDSAIAWLRDVLDDSDQDADCFRFIAANLLTILAVNRGLETGD